MKNQGFKINDVYRFRYHEDVAKKNYIDIYHCFDGILIVKERDNGTKYLQDTYWGDGSSRVIYIEELDKKGTINFLCNLDEMREIQESEMVYYNDSDIVRLGIHAGYRTKTLIKKGAVRSKDKMIQSIQSKIKEAERDIEFRNSSIERLKETLSKVENSDLSVYI